MKFSLLFAFIFSLISNVACSSEAEVLVNEFVAVILSKGRMPTLKDYYYYFGEGSEGEIIIDQEYCKGKNWIPPSKHPLCTEYINNRWKRASEEPSKYLAWLRSQLPLSPKVEIVTVERIQDSGVFSHERIHTKVGGKDVIFVRPLKVSEIRVFGKISVSEVESIPLDLLFKKTR